MNRLGEATDKKKDAIQGREGNFGLI